MTTATSGGATHAVVWRRCVLFELTLVLLVLFHASGSSMADRPQQFVVGGRGVTVNAMFNINTAAAAPKRTSSSASTKSAKSARKRSFGPRRGSGVHDNIAQTGTSMPRAPSMYGKRKRKGSATNAEMQLGRTCVLWCCE